MRMLYVVVALMLGIHPQAYPAAPSAETLNPQHLTALDQKIQECAEKVNTCGDEEQKCAYRQELCKLFIQRKDYEHAYMVATEIFSATTNAERKAAHHFLRAEIYVMKMEASSSVAAMEDNRTKALQLAREVLAQGYPEKWGVNRAAQQLVNRLEDAKQMDEVRAWAAKRASGGADDQQVALAKAQSASIQSGGKVSYVPPAVYGKSSSRAQVEPAKAKTGSLNRLRSVFSSDKKPTNEPSIWDDNSAKKTEPQATPSRSSVAAGDLKYGTVSNKRLLQQPIIIDGANVRQADRIETEQTSSLGKAWPTPPRATR